MVLPSPSSKSDPEYVRLMTVKRGANSNCCETLTTWLFASVLYCVTAQRRTLLTKALSVSSFGGADVPCHNYVMVCVFRPVMFSVMRRVCVKHWCICLPMHAHARTQHARARAHTHTHTSACARANNYICQRYCQPGTCRKHRESIVTFLEQLKRSDAECPVLCSPDSKVIPPSVKISLASGHRTRDFPIGSDAKFCQIIRNYTWKKYVISIQSLQSRH